MSVSPEKKTQAIIQNLLKAENFPHPVVGFTCLETHISWIILTGTYAYKIKKPMNYDFLDFTTLEKRYYFCNLECTLNQRFTKEIYVKVLPITGDEAHPVLDGEGEIIEYAIQMHEFPQEHLLLNYAKSHSLQFYHIEQLAIELARIHQNLPKDIDSHYGSYEQIREPVQQNFSQIKGFLKEPEDFEELTIQEQWTNYFYRSNQTLFQERKRQGFIRECHGDCHLGNIVWLNSRPVLFDAIEFNEAFRFTDTMADVGFLMMDLLDHQQFALAWRFLNVYLENTHDYEGIEILPYYIAYRAVVRAKITLFDYYYSSHTNDHKLYLFSRYRALIQLANQFAKPKNPKLILTHGFSGSGKTTLAKFYSVKIGALHIRSDIIRKYLADLPSNAQLNSPYLAGIYSPDFTDKTYQTMLDLAKKLIMAGFSVILDATFLKRSQRQPFYELAEQLQVLIEILKPQAPLEELKERILKRQFENQDPSEARLDILEHQLEIEDALDALEQTYCVDIS